jgi:hypothetical protein
MANQFISGASVLAGAVGAATKDMLKAIEAQEQAEYFRSDRIRVRVSSIADERLYDGWFSDRSSPMLSESEKTEIQRVVELYEAHRVCRKVGFGHQVTIEMPLSELRDVQDYWLSVVGALESMTSQERGSSGTTELRACRQAVQRVNEAVAARRK